MNGEARTIAAIASPPGPGARGILRVSGARAADVVRAVWRVGAFDPTRRAYVAGRFDDGVGTLPAHLAWMPAPRSYTGEDVAEFHVPGSPPLLARAFARLLESGASPAEPGEFTRRAFLSGRIDLTRAEGVAALVSAHDAHQARAARALLFGGLERRVGAVHDALLDARSLCEASLDFGEGDTGHVPTDEVIALVDLARARVAEARAFDAARARPSGTPRVVLAGAPNAGKSSLFNALVGREDALVSPRVGTTRDVLDAHVVFGEFAARLFDTAGIDAQAGPEDLASARADEDSRVDAPAELAPESAAAERARAARTEADLVVWVVDAARRGDPDLAREAAGLGPAPRVLAWSKCDSAGADDDPSPALEPRSAERLAERAVVTSARTGAGLDALRAALAAELGALASGGGLERETALRHAAALDEVGAELLGARHLLGRAGALELAAEHLRRATTALEAISGASTPEDVLDRIFARFCLGK